MARSSIIRAVIGGEAPPRHKRRKQEERRAETRARLIEAVITVINRRGFAGLRSKHVTAVSGMTWGAAQHLFGDMNELLLEVASRVSDALAKQLNGAFAERALPLRERLRAVVELVWGLYSSADYFAMVEIVRGTRDDVRFHNKLVETLGRLSEHIEELWLSIFADVRIGKARSLALCNIVVLTLSGLAARRIYLRLTPDTDRMLEELVDCVSASLDAGAVGVRPTPRVRRVAAAI